MGCWLCQFLYCLQSNLPQKARILYYKIAVGKALTGAFCSRERSFLSARASKRRFSEVTPTEAPLHLPEYKAKRSIAVPKEPTIRPSFIAQLAKSHHAYLPDRRLFTRIQSPKSETVTLRSCGMNHDYTLGKMLAC